MQRGTNVRCFFACPPLSTMQVLCNTDDWIADALRMKNIFKNADRYGSRAVSANQNGWVQKLVGPKTPLDVQGFDYSTDKYDEWHLQACRPQLFCHQPTMSTPALLSSANHTKHVYASSILTRHAGAGHTQHFIRDQQRRERQGRVSFRLSCRRVTSFSNNTCTT